MDPSHAADIADLDSASAQLQDILGRVTQLASGFESARVEDAANDLYDVERHLTAAIRRVDSLVRRLQ
mgnify:CR=1 FL=1